MERWKDKRRVLRLWARIAFSLILDFAAAVALCSAIIAFGLLLMFAVAKFRGEDFDPVPSWPDTSLDGYNLTPE